MKTFTSWVETNHPQSFEEGILDLGKKAVATGLTAGALAIGGCKGGDCPTPQSGRTTQQPTQQQSGRTITIDDGREIQVPLNVDPVEYLQQVNQTRAEMGQPPLPIDKTMRYFDGMGRH